MFRMFGQLGPAVRNRRRTMVPIAVPLAVVIVVLLAAVLTGNAGATDSRLAPVVNTVATEADGPEVVTVGAYINDIQSLDLRNYTYRVDFYLWLKWDDPEFDPALTLGQVNPFNYHDSVEKVLYDEPIQLEDGQYYTAIRYLGEFSTKMPLADFPFDDQVLSIKLEDESYDSSGVVYVPDKEPVVLDKYLLLPGYNIMQPTMHIEDFVYDSTFGFEGAAASSYSRITIDVPVSRPWFTNLMKVLLPVLLVAAVAAMVFFLDPTYVDARLGMGITAMLTLVALQFTTAADLPQTEYLMMLDVLYIIAYGYVMLVLASVVATSQLAKKGQEDAALALDKKLMVLTTLVYVGALALTFWFFLR